MCTHRPLIKLTLNLQRAHGWCFASEAKKRKMLGEDTEHGAGVGTIPGAEDELEKRGILVIVRAMPHSTMPDGNEATSGTRLTKVLKSSRERLAARLEYQRRLSDRRKREPHAKRPRRVCNEAMAMMPVEKLVAGITRPANPSRPRALTLAEVQASREADYKAEVARQLEALRALPLDWETQRPAGKDPPTPGK
jgi:hypothetical protein